MSSERYARQTRFEPLGPAGQAAISRSRAVIVGCGALGGTSAELLARAGCGHLTLIDRDYVEINNLQRQVLFSEADAKEVLPKAIAAQRRLRAINSHIEIQGVVDDLMAHNADDLLGGANVIVDGTDNFEARYLINDYAVKHGVDWIYGAALGSYGLVMPILPGRSACFRCVYPSPPEGAQPTCETAGVLGPITSMVGSLQAAIALQILSGNRASVRLKITTSDVWYGPLREIDQADRQPTCPCCGQLNFEWLTGGREAPASLCGRNAVQIHSRDKSVDLADLRLRLAGMGEVRANEFALRLRKDPYEITVFSDGRAIVKGTTDIGVARAVYAQLLG